MQACGEGTEKLLLVIRSTARLVCEKMMGGMVPVKIIS